VATAFADLGFDVDGAVNPPVLADVEVNILPWAARHHNDRSQNAEPAIEGKAQNRA
jgi:hypothetical protein